MKVLLTGATGFLGSAIARALTARQHDLRVLVRHTSPLAALSDVACERVFGDITEPSSVGAALAGMDAVIHTAGFTGTRLRDRERLYRVNTEGVRTICQAMQERGPKRLVLTSSIVSIGTSSEPTPLDESTPWTGGGQGYHYVDSKRQGEELAFAATGLEVVAVNPGFILGPGDARLTSTRYVSEYVGGRNIFYLPTGGLSFCDVRDVALAHVAALERGRPGQRYITAGHNVTHRQALEELHALTGLTRPRALPKTLALAACVASELAAKLTRHSLEDLNRPFIRYSTHYCFYSSVRAQAELGYHIRPLREMWTDTLKYQLSHGIIAARSERLRQLSLVS